MKKKAGLIALFLLGLCIMLYPTVSNWWNNRISEMRKVEYETAVEDRTDSEKEADLEAARAYNSSLELEKVPDAFSVRDNVQDETYEALLNPVGDGLIGQVSIPSIDVDIPIYHYTTDDVLQKGAGHLLSLIHI